MPPPPRAPCFSPCIRAVPLRLVYQIYPIWRETKSRGVSLPAPRLAPTMDATLAAVGSWRLVGWGKDHKPLELTT
jgi:hypothetical protein